MREKSHIHSEDRELLKDLYKARGPLNIYHFHERYQLSPAQLARSVREFEVLGVISLDGNYVSLTEKGRRWILANRHELFCNSNKLWKTIPDEILQSENQTAEPYIPKRKELSPEFMDEYGG